jgi:iron complex transport system substrate-binding protein
LSFIVFLLAASRAAALPSVVSINLCTDQLLLTVADPAQIVSVSWLAADPEESMLADAAARYPLNYGSAEELLRLGPDVVVAGAFTNTYTRRLLRELGYTVVDVEPAESLDDIERNLLLVAEAIDRRDAGTAAVAGMRETAARIRSQRPADPVPAIVIRPGSFTVGDASLAHELMTLAGIDNIAAADGLDRWGSLSIEALLLSAPSLLIVTGYRRDQASLANTVFDHPALARLAQGTAITAIPGRYWACGLPDSLASAELLQRLPAAAE